MATILVVDDEQGIRSFLREALRTEGHEVDEAADGSEALRKMARRAYQVVLTDLKLPGMDGTALLERIREDHPEVEVIVLTAYGTVESAVHAMKLGAFDYIQKPVASPSEVRLLVQRAAERYRARGLTEVGGEGGEIRLTWGAPAMVPVARAVERVARTEATVLLLGESGTGKEVVAQAIHRLGARASGPFMAVNCAALSESLLESELFGHEKGAFTGALARRRGRIEAAEGGTFFLDEIGELKPALQAKLLRVLQERRFERVGGNQSIVCNVRWIAATNRDLKAMMKDGAFREDLYHRLAVFPIQIPPLRERLEDLPYLAEALAARIGANLGLRALRIDSSALDLLRKRPWPGNIRQLANAIERAAILAGTSTLRAEHFAFETEASPASGSCAQTLEDLEREAIRRALDLHGGNRRKAAEHLGIGLRTLYEKLKKYGAG
jgi:two-component system response regulator AtoC